MPQSAHPAVMQAGSRRRRRHRGVAAAWCAAAVAISIGLATATRAVENEEGPDGPQGLQGILPETIPRDIDFEALTALGPNWEAWGEAAAEEVATLYTPEGLSVAEQREVIAKLRQRIRVMERALSDEKYRVIHDELIGLTGRLQRRLDVAEAILDLLEQDFSAVPAEHVDPARQRVVAAVNRLHDYLRTLRGGERWLTYVQGSELLQLMQPPTPPEQAVSVAASVLERLQAADQAQNDQQREFLGRPEFEALREALTAYLDVAAPPPVTPESLRDPLAALVAALEEYELNNLEESAARARAAYRDLKAATGDRLGPLTEALRVHYFNYNVQIIATENFLNRIVADQQNESSPVRDCILGAFVSGWQCTSAFTSLNLRPSLENALIEFRVDGTVQSNTTGSTSQGSVRTVGHHRFWASKDVLFDGEHFLTRPAMVSVDVNSQTVGISTKYDRIPIIRRFAQRAARRRVAERTPQANAITRSKIVERVSDELNREVADQLAEAESNLNNDTYARLRAGGLYPEVSLVRTTEDLLRLKARTWDPDELGGGTPTPLLTQHGKGATVHVHESFLNHAADQMNLRGRTMTNQQIEEEIERYLSVVLGRDVNFSDTEDESAEEEEGSFIFVERDPLRFRVTEGELLVILRAGLQRPDEEAIPPQIITIPVGFRVEQDGLVIVRGTPIIEPVEEPENAGEQIARAGVMRRKIEQSIAEESRRDRKVMIDRGNNVQVPVWVTRVKALNGWVTIWAE